MPPSLSISLIKIFNLYVVMVGIPISMRGDRHKKMQLVEQAKIDQTVIDEIKVVDVSDYRPRRIPSPTWHECIKKIWEVDSLECPRCGAEMKIISFITEQAVIRKILVHLDLWEAQQERSPPEVAARDMPPPRHETVYEPSDDGLSEYEEPFVTVR